MDPNLFYIGSMILAVFLGIAVGTWLPIIVEYTINPVINFITYLIKNI